MSKSTNPHILIFPFPAQGHMLPLLDLAHQLSLRSSSISITILITPKNLPILTPLLTTHPTIQTLIIPFPTTPHPLTIPTGVENVKDLPSSGFPAMMFALGNLYDPILHWFNSHPSPPPTAVVYDFFLGWMQGLCRRVGVCGYVFSPSGGLSLSIIYSLWRDKPALVDNNDGDGKNKKEIISFPKVPKSPSYPWWQISYIYRSFAENEEDPLCKFIESIFVGDLSSDGLILNAFDEMEGDYLAHLKEVLGHDRVWAVGPLLPLDDDDMARERGGSSLVSGEEVCKWLDRCEDRSVVYVCFGSQVVLTNEQMKALTEGLEKSGVRFVLVYKSASKGHVDGEKFGSIPSGFKERVAERGLLINGWAPQVSVLKHPAVGAFLFHCGWNTVLENILLAGVPMLVWPMIADQYANATLIVDELKIGARVCEGLETVPDSDKLARLLAKAIGELDQERMRSTELHKVALAAIRKGGSSFEGLNDLATHLSQRESTLHNETK